MATEKFLDSADREWEYLDRVVSYEVGEYTHLIVLRKNWIHDPRSPSAFVLTKEIEGTRNLVDGQGTVYRKKIV